MQPFDLPDFYLPWPARLNPNLETARAHSKSWGFEMGLLQGDGDYEGVAIWDEEEFDAMDFGLFCAYCHPDADQSGLELATDWYVWGFFVDDYFLEVFKRSQDRSGGRAFLDRLPLFMPVDLPAEIPEPVAPIERSIADLWARTAPNRDRAWRERYFDDVLGIVEDNIWELTNISAGRISNPVEYLEVRRKMGGGVWVATLTECIESIQIPPAVAVARPFRVLTESFADAAHLRNDIFSYERETREEGELTNMVLVVEHFLGVGAQEAANLTNDIITSRLYQFENTFFTELPPMFDELGLDAVERENIVRYVKALQDCQAGGHEWHSRSSRYMHQEPAADFDQSILGGPTGLGIAAARIGLTPGGLGLRHRAFSHTPFKVVGTTDLPDLDLATEIRLNPLLDHSRRDTVDWCRRMGMLEPIPRIPGLGPWDERGLMGSDFPLCAAAMNPDSDLEKLDLTSDWLAWIAYADDFFPVVFGHQRNLSAARMFVNRLMEFVPEGSIPATMPANPVERGLADLWMRSTASIVGNARQRLRTAVESVVQSWPWELANLIENRVPDPTDYIEMRRRTSASAIHLALILGPVADQVPAGFLASRPMHGLSGVAQDYVGLVNDLFSYQKEIEHEGDLNNGVLVVEKFMDCDQARGVRVVADVTTARMSQLNHIVATELRPLYEEFGLDKGAKQAVDGAVEGLQRWMAAVLNWHRNTARYSRSPVLGRPTPSRLLHCSRGLGGAAGRIRPTNLPEVRVEIDAPVRTGFAAPRNRRETWRGS